MQEAKADTFGDCLPTVHHWPPQFTCLSCAKGNKLTLLPRYPKSYPTVILAPIFHLNQVQHGSVIWLRISVGLLLPA